MNALARYQKNHQNQYSTPTIFDLFSRPIADFGTLFDPLTATTDNIKVDVKDCGDKYRIIAEMPGVKKEDIKVDFQDGTLSISAEHNTQKEEKDEQGYLIRERTSGCYKRSFYFEDIDPNEINAAFANGELDISLNKAKKAEKSTQITIH
ncbi:MAG: Hsp20/alpha crystallin family protein [Succinivibrio sp.]|nr:Hsp20/alpha crystallin family protein [Succinivibrio sp.]